LHPSAAKGLPTAQPLEKYFTAVHWDQYGVGKSYDKKLKPEEISTFKIPVYFLEGRHDYCVPSVLV
jgi:hypothetical protein